jgi:hypothetical protein
MIARAQRFVRWWGAAEISKVAPARVIHAPPLSPARSGSRRPGTPQPGQVRPLASRVDSAVILECLAQRRIRGARCVPHRAMGVLMNERTINVSNAKPRAIVVDVALLCAIDAQSRGLFSR